MMSQGARKSSTISLDERIRVRETNAFRFERVRFANGTERGFAVTKSGISLIREKLVGRAAGLFAKDLPNLKILFGLANEFRKVRRFRRDETLVHAFVQSE